MSCTAGPRKRTAKKASMTCTDQGLRSAFAGSRPGGLTGTYSAICTCLFTGHAFTLRSQAASPARGDAAQRRSGFTTCDSTQGWLAVRLVPEPKDGLWRSTSGGYVPSAINKGPAHPAQAPAVQLPSHDQSHQRRGRRASQGRGPPSSSALPGHHLAATVSAKSPDPGPVPSRGDAPHLRKP